jgi:hypothetical protein
MKPDEITLEKKSESNNLVQMSCTTNEICDTLDKSDAGIDASIEAHCITFGVSTTTSWMPSPPASNTCT